LKKQKPDDDFGIPKFVTIFHWISEQRDAPCRPSLAAAGVPPLDDDDYERGEAASLCSWRAFDANFPFRPKAIAYLSEKQSPVMGETFAAFL
jgi:hypothetical protein